LVLIDGVESYLDPSALSPGMVEAVEVSLGGSMPQYAARSAGRVVNIRLKRDYDEREVGFEGSATIHGDAWQRQAMISGGSFHGRLRALYSVRASKRDAVTADARDFSREQDRRAGGGRDFRTPWGEAPVIRAATGPLAGLTDATGAPVSTARVADGAGAPVGPGDFIGVPGDAAGQRHFNTSPYLYLGAPSEQRSGNLELQYAAGPRLNFSLTTSAQASGSVRRGPPPVTAASAATRVPAAFSPFGQDLEVGLVHTGFGPAIQRSRARLAQVALGAHGRWGEEWRWNAQLGWRRRETARTVRDLDPAKLTAALAALDPAERFDPFVPSANARLYPDLAVERRQDSHGDETDVRFRAHGPIAAGWSPGPLRATFGGQARYRRDERIFRDIAGVEDGTLRDEDRGYGLDASTEVPLLPRERPGLRRLEARITGGIAGRDNGGMDRRVEASLLWSPVRSVAIRLNLERSRSDPGALDDGDDSDITLAETLDDPRRVPAVAQNVQVITRREAQADAGEGEERELSVTFAPAAVKGLRLMVRYEEEVDRNSSGPTLDPQDVIDNEAALPGRIVRAEPTESDLALGQPGALLSIDATAAQVATRERARVNFSAEYRREHPQGVFRFSASARRLLRSRYELQSGVPFLSNSDGPSNSPGWSGQGGVSWQRAGWTASVQVRHSSANERRTVPSMTDLGVSCGYRFRTAFLGTYGKGAHLQAGLRNLLRGEPPAADTVLGYRGGSPLGTTVHLTVRLPL
ncbi:MAG TPA: hypothetical protein VEB66_11865, partial [Opitutaceae bacterium]|nr:hypothetical protein [Opitutaceae bacterium]